MTASDAATRMKEPKIEKEWHMRQFHTCNSKTQGFLPPPGPTGSPAATVHTWTEVEGENRIPDARFWVMKEHKEHSSRVALNGHIPFTGVGTVKRCPGKVS